jgi:Fe2+ or Zn2+ uptake regulation protein
MKIKKFNINENFSSILKNNDSRKFINLVFLPSGEVFELSNQEIEELNSYVVLEYNSKLKSYTIDDHLINAVIMALNYQN